LFIRTDVLPSFLATFFIVVHLHPCFLTLYVPLTSTQPCAGRVAMTCRHATLWSGQRCVRPAQNFDQTARCPIASANSSLNICHSHTITGECYTFFASSHATNSGTTSWLSLVALKLFSDWPRPLPSHNSDSFTVIVELITSEIDKTNLNKERQIRAVKMYLKFRRKNIKHDRQPAYNLVSCFLRLVTTTTERHQRINLVISYTFCGQLCAIRRRCHRNFSSFALHCIAFILLRHSCQHYKI